MKQKKFEKFIENCENFIEERSDLALKEVAKNSKYKEKYQAYSNIYDTLIKKIGENDLERLTSSIYMLNDFENDYIYMQGLLDGILLRENFEE